MIDLEEIDDPHHTKDFRRANGAPMIVDKDGKNQRFSRPSGWGKELDDENALVNWKIDTAIRGVAGDKAIQARAVAAKEDDRSTKASIREAAIQAGRGNQASDIGTALHAMSERWEKEPTFDPGEPFRSSLEAYSKELDRLGLVSELFEYHVVNLEYRAAGTADRLYRLTRPLITPRGEVLPEGTLIVGDLKTGKSLDFSLPGYTVQMAIYATGEMYDVVTDQFRPTPDINREWGLIVHMPAERSGECEITWCDLTVGAYGAYLVFEVRDWRRKWKSSEYSNPTIITPDVERLNGLVELRDLAVKLDAEILDTAEADAEWLSGMIPFIKSRMTAIRDNPDATKKLLISWPEDVPPPKAISTVKQAEKILTLLDKIEADYGLQFPSGDPRASTGGHKSTINHKEKK